MIIEVLEQCLVWGEMASGDRSTRGIGVDDLLVVAEGSVDAEGTKDFRSALEFDEQDSSTARGEGATHGTGDSGLSHPTLAEEESDRRFVP